MKDFQVGQWWADKSGAKHLIVKVIPRLKISVFSMWLSWGADGKLHNRNVGHLDLVNRCGPDYEKIMRFGYTNYKGEYSVRDVVPKRMFFGESAWNAKPQYVMEAFDLDRQAMRSFALADMVMNPKVSE